MSVRGRVESPKSAIALSKAGSVVSMDRFSGGRAAIRASDAVAVLMAASHRAVISPGRNRDFIGEGRTGDVMVHTLWKNNR
jgi:hypothetical protein